jgi:hypothetical protein
MNSTIPSVVKDFGPKRILVQKTGSGVGADL